MSEEPDAAPPGGAPQRPGEPGAAEPGTEETGPRVLRMRRAPRYRAFGFTGTALGVLVGVVVALSFSATSDYSTRTIAGYFAAIFALFGAVVGLGLAVLIERRHGS